MRSGLTLLVLAGAMGALACATSSPPRPQEALATPDEASASEEESAPEPVAPSPHEWGAAGEVPDAVAYEGEAMELSGPQREGEAKARLTGGTAATVAVHTEVEELRELIRAQRDAVVHLLRKARGKEQRDRLWDAERSLLKAADRLRHIEEALRRDPALAEDRDLQAELSEMRVAVMRMDFLVEVVTE